MLLVTRRETIKNVIKTERVEMKYKRNMKFTSNSRKILFKLIPENIYLLMMLYISKLIAQHLWLMDLLPKSY